MCILIHFRFFFFFKLYLFKSSFLGIIPICIALSPGPAASAQLGCTLSDAEPQLLRPLAILGKGHSEFASTYILVPWMNHPYEFLDWSIPIWRDLPFLNTYQHAQWILPRNTEVPSFAVSPVVTGCTLHAKTFLVPVWDQLTWDFHSSVQLQALSRD